MPDAVLDTARNFLQSFIKPCRILVAVSGGSDSMGLLVALHSALAADERPGFSLAACTVDHALRPQSAREAEDVAAFCAALGIAHRTSRWVGAKPSTGIQAAARNKRYELLAEAAEALGADCIATGHTRDDQQETVAMRGARRKDDGRHDLEGEGQGGGGMAAAMLYGRRIWVLRPFLALGRAQIRSLLEARGVAWIDDPSNTNPAFERVRVRARIALSGGVPVPSWDGRQRAASSARAATLIEQRIRVHEALVAEISARDAGAMDDRDWRRALLAVASVLGGREHMPARATVQRLSQFLRSGEPGRMTAGRVVFDRRASGLYLYREARNLPVLAVGPGGQGLWDGRFTVKSGGPALTVAADASGGLWTQRLIDAGLPAGIAKRASAVAPGIAPTGAAGLAYGEAAAKVEYHIALYDTFLPGFDRIMADAVAVSFGRDRYPAPPVHDVLTEMEM
ncbi:tRNA lysidine(34) synthetase TilS [Mesorhizobium plurifarium]|uniref:tRNA lysidine(34) synthetase TilS n=1 Tax=Sinorhizobium arboris TaxID=76745 RepID=UPI000408BC04|nr:tRNA lysidine(34) synthetase TilS [Sinorhizobium arboris]PST18592.1 tRNA lysidine(34) synthetase TilS [Mesorhizobium plurifarium]